MAPWMGIKKVRCACLPRPPSLPQFHCCVRVGANEVRRGRQGPTLPTHHQTPPFLSTARNLPFICPKIPFKSLPVSPATCCTLDCTQACACARANARLNDTISGGWSQEKGPSQNEQCHAIREDDTILWMGNQERGVRAVTHARTHAPTRARTHGRTCARAHTHGPREQAFGGWGRPAPLGCSVQRIPLAGQLTLTEPHPLATE
mmetsp:Transcript_32039/g.51994  ORF Transcript_32039/g.51994 Transcript_32039/m.51994 type:complete len:204 (-) Transcript_32039:269-880(-)